MAISEYLDDTGLAHLWSKIKSKVDQNSLKLCGSVDSSNPLPTNAVVGETYYVASAGTYGGATCEVGDFIVCTVASESSPTWKAIQANIKPYASNPNMDGSASAGSSADYARGDHRHPTDTSRAPLASPAFTGTPTAPTASSTTSSTQLATTAFVQNVVNEKIAASDAMIYKGTIGTGGTITSLPNIGYKTGWTYKVITAGTYAGQVCEIGDMIIALNDGPSSGSSVVNADWTVVQNNVDVMTGATSSTAGTKGLVPAPASGNQNKFLRADGTWQSPADTENSITSITASGSGNAVTGVTISGHTATLNKNSTFLTSHQNIKHEGVTGATANHYTTCSTAAATAQKDTSSTGSGTFTLETGARVIVKFTNANSAANPTLNVNSTGAKAIRWRNAALPSSKYWTANGVVEFIYDGTYWNMIGAANDNNTTYGVATTSANGLMSSTDKSKLNGIATGAEVNVQSDWNVTDTTQDAYILNKPTPITNDEIDSICV